MFRPIKRGLQLIGAWMRLFFLAVRKGNPEAIRDGIAVGELWISETFRETGDVLDVKINPAGLLFGNGDPWKDSRALYQKYEVKWKGRL
jgi:hypothetical protein